MSDDVVAENAEIFCDKAAGSIIEALMYAVLIKHKTAEGRRDDVASIWKRHMAPAVDGHDGHLLYIYCFGERENEICAFQIYRSAQDAAAFLESDTYKIYVDEVQGLLSDPPEVTALHPQWTKFPSATVQPPLPVRPSNSSA